MLHFHGFYQPVVQLLGTALFQITDLFPREFWNCGSFPTGDPCTVALNMFPLYHFLKPIAALLYFYFRYDSVLYSFSPFTCHTLFA